MTHDPTRLATVEQIVNGNSPFETVDTPLGAMERWRAEAMLIGTTSGVESVFKAIRADAAERAARADADQARTALIQHLCAKVDAFQSKLDNLVAQVAAEREARRADEARQAKLDEEPITLPPDLQRSQDPKKIGDDTPTPDGHLHSVAAKGEPSEDPDFEVEDTDNEGDLPKELQKDTPPAPSTYPSFELPKPPVVSQPVSISLNEE
jgi:hypothetical protein